MEFTVIQWLVVLLCALMIGVSKTGVPGVGVLVVPLMAVILPARLSTGFVLPMLIVADVVAVVYYRRQVEWKYLAELAPATVAGILAGWLGMKFWFTEDHHLGPIIGVIVLAMLGVHLYRERRAEGLEVSERAVLKNLKKPPLHPSEEGKNKGEYRSDNRIPHHWLFSTLMGVLAGFTTMLANAAGPIMIIYLLSKRLPKNLLIGTGSWFFFSVNVFKIPFQINLNNIRFDTIQMNLLLAPVIIGGAFAGLWLVKRIPQKVFNSVIQILAALAAVKLLNIF